MCKNAQHAATGAVASAATPGPGPKPAGPHDTGRAAARSAGGFARGNPAKLAESPRTVRPRHRLRRHAADGLRPGHRQERAMESAHPAVGRQLARRMGGTGVPDRCRRDRPRGLLLRRGQREDALASGGQAAGRVARRVRGHRPCRLDGGHRREALLRHLLDRRPGGGRHAGHGQVDAFVRRSQEQLRVRLVADRLQAPLRADGRQEQLDAVRAQSGHWPRGLAEETQGARIVGVAGDRPFPAIARWSCWPRTRRPRRTTSTPAR